VWRRPQGSGVRGQWLETNATRARSSSNVTAPSPPAYVTYLRAKSLKIIKFVVTKISNIGSDMRMLHGLSKSAWRKASGGIGTRSPTY
jgi:hypothetical protein